MEWSKNGQSRILPHPGVPLNFYLRFVGDKLMNKKQVLLLCTGNSCRSQMAESLVNHYLADQWQAYSAGTAPTGYVHPMAIEVMSELEIDISEYRSKSVDKFRGFNFDVVITVCDDAAENCPVWLGSGRVIHIGFPDPAEAGGSELERLGVFQQVRDDMGKRVLNYLTEEFKTTAEIGAK
jgi:arsenate reductase